MRQRLLLVAGWVLGAVGTSVVASAAVAATGGQVTDRPLRPLTAVEVAALPNGFLDVLSESLASGDSSNGDGQEPTESNTPGQHGTNPAGAEGEPPSPVEGPFSGIDRSLTDDASFLRNTADGVEAVLSDLPEVVEPDPVAVGDVEAVTDSQVEHLAGGSVSVASSGDMVTLLWATPALGWSVAVDHFDESQLIVIFTDGNVSWTVTAKVTAAGALDVATQQTGV